MLRTPLVYLPVFLLSGFAPCQERGAALPPDRAKGAQTIQAEDIRPWLQKLTSPEFGGRGTGQPGFQLAADFLRDHFKAIGLKPGTKDGKYLQPVPWTEIKPDAEKWKFQVRKGEQTAADLALTDVHGSLVSELKAQGKALAAIVSDLEDPPLEAADLTGAIVFLVVTDQGDHSARTRSRAIMRMERSARRNGAAAAIVVDDVAFGQYGALKGPTYPGTSRAAAGRFRRALTQLAISRASFGRLLKALNKSEANVLGHDGVLELGAEVRLEAPVVRGQAPAYNVVAVLPGSDPKLAAEYVIIGCHLDHLGKRGDTYYPGADDDGSGSAGLMAISRAFASNGTPPRRSVMFVAFCGEEMGLIGSGYFAKNPPVDLKQVVAELQIDMIGRDEQKRGEKAEDNKNSVHLVGTRRLSPELHELCLRLNQERAKFDFEWDEENVYSRSDHFNFAKHGVPIAFLFTGFHPDYHKPTDTVDKINFEKLARVARYVYDLGFELAQQDGRPKVDPNLWSKMRGKARIEPAAPRSGS